MSMTDPIADMLTRIRNGYKAKHVKVDVPGSKIKHEIAKILVTEGFVKEVDLIKDTRQDVIRVFLKYDENERPAVSGLKRVSRPGLRRYAGARSIPSVMGGLGIAIISTPEGLVTDRQARKNKVGGEVVCYVW